MKTIRIVFGAALLVTGGAAAAQSATDARCIILSSAFAKESKDPQAQKLAEASLYFYLGRIGQTTAAQLKAVMVEQSKTINQATAGGLMNDCVKGLQAKMDLMQSLSPPPQPTATTPAPTTKKPEGR